jgi:hypothetical protein
VSASTLGRVCDPEALDEQPGARARLRIEVPATWLEDGVDLLVTAPAMLTCARCDGGGCDGCGRSGALRAPDDPEDRVVRARIGANAGVARMTLRIVQPFGPDGGIDQLLMEVVASDSASPGVSRVAALVAPDQASPRLAVRWPAVVLTLTSLAAIATALVELLRH